MLCVPRASPVSQFANPLSFSERVFAYWNVWISLRVGITAVTLGAVAFSIPFLLPA